MACALASYLCCFRVAFLETHAYARLVKDAVDGRGAACQAQAVHQSQVGVAARPGRVQRQLRLDGSLGPHRGH